MSNVKNSVKNSRKKPRGNPEAIAAFKFKPGESGNPNGRPKGKLNFDTRVDMAIEELSRRLVKIHNRKYKNKITEDDVDIEGDIFMQLLNKARNGNDRMLDSYLDRRHGKAMQSLKVGGIIGNVAVSEENVEKVTAEVDEWFGMWAKDDNKDAKATTKKGTR